jgi:hypothetical protein
MPNALLAGDDGAGIAVVAGASESVVMPFTRKC